MKKTYNSPTIKVVKMQPRNLLAGSAYGIDIKSRGASTGYESLSRRGSFSDWDDYEE